MSTYTEEELQAHHKRSSKNQSAIKSAEQVGCFYCLAVFPAAEVKEFIDNQPSGDAVCPKCSTDSVIADDGTSEFSPELLQALRKHYFC